MVSLLEESDVDLERLSRTNAIAAAATTAATIATMIHVDEPPLLPPGIHSAVMVASPSVTKSASGFTSHLAVDPSVDEALFSPSEPGAVTVNLIVNTSSSVRPSISAMASVSAGSPASSSTPSSTALKRVPSASCSMENDEVSSPSELSSAIGTSLTVHPTPTSPSSSICRTLTSYWVRSAVRSAHGSSPPVNSSSKASPDSSSSDPASSPRRPANSWSCSVSIRTR
jgi:hypothetical protein